MLLIIANIAVLLHMLTAFQVFGQAVFNTVESWVKWYLVRREAKAAKSAAHSKDGMHVPHTDLEAKHARDHKKLLGLDHVKLDPISERQSSSMIALDSRGAMSTAISQMCSDECSLTSRRSSVMRESMYATSTGFANEQVPLNEDGLFVPFWVRLVVRSCYVLLITVVACVFPFFGAIAGLVGAVTFFPLSIYFPYALYRKVYKVGTWFSALLWTIWTALLVVAILATIGSVRNIIVQSSTYKVRYMHRMHCSYCSWQYTCSLPTHVTFAIVRGCRYSACDTS